MSRFFQWVFDDVGGFSKSLVDSHGSHGPMQGPAGPANKLGAWCRSSPGRGTHFQNPNFEISSILALLACLRRFGTLKKNAIPQKPGMYPDFLSMYSPFWGMYPPYLGWLQFQQLTLQQIILKLINAVR